MLVLPGPRRATGIWVIQANGAELHENVVTTSGANGIHVGEGSGGNLLFDKLVSRSGSLDVFDQGSGNCWKGTTYLTADPNPPPTC